MEKLKVLIIEDELIIAEDIRMTLDTLGYDVVGLATTYNDAITLLSETSPDIVLSDIALDGEKDGIDLGVVIRDKFELPLVFLTSHSDKTTLERAKTVKPNGYLVKPFEAEDLYTSIEVALVNFSGITPTTGDGVAAEGGFLVKDAIYVKDGNYLKKVVLSELMFVKAEGNYVELHSKEKRNVIRSSLRELLEKLPENQFVRVHKSYAINIQCVEAINSLSVVVGSEVIPMGRNFREVLLTHLRTI